MDFFLADDLSGALDAAAAFHHAGRRVRIVLSVAAWTRQTDDDVIGVTTETRNAGPAEAASAVARAIAHGYAFGAQLVYKKIDSTLRGPVAAELAALATALPQAQILFAPANPSVGRTVREGRLLVHGVPLAETEFARDPVSPVTESVIRRLLGEALPGARVTIADTETEEDLARSVAQMDAAGQPWIGVGSGALARPVAARTPGNGNHETGAGPQRTSDGDMRQGMQHPHVGRSSAADSRPPTPHLCLMVCGSAHPGNREQARMLARERSVPVHELRLDAPEAAIAFARANLATYRGAALVIEQRRGNSGIVVEVLAQTVAAILAHSPVARVFVTGGETAFALCRALNVTALTFCAEIEAGSSVSRGEALGGPVLFAVKPGGFGDARTWVRAWDALVAT